MFKHVSLATCLTLIACATQDGRVADGYVAGSPMPVGECPYTVEFPGPPKSVDPSNVLISVPWDRQLSLVSEDAVMAYAAYCGCSDTYLADDINIVEALADAEASAKKLEMKLINSSFTNDPQMGKNVELAGEMPSTRGPLKLQYRRYFVGHCSFGTMAGGRVSNYDQQRGSRFLDSARRIGAEPKSSAPAAVPSSDNAHRLQELKDLYDRQLITKQEYEARRKAILDAL